MSKKDYQPSPNADSYYDRLGVDVDSELGEIKSAGKFAFKSYQESDREDFFRVRQAKETLVDDDLRDSYDTFCSQLGTTIGTEAFEDWESSGRKEDVQSVISRYRDRYQITSNNSDEGQPTLGFVNSHSSQDDDSDELDFTGGRVPVDKIRSRITTLQSAIDDDISDVQLIEELDRYVNEYYIPIDDATDIVKNKYNNSDVGVSKTVNSSDALFDGDGAKNESDSEWDHESISIDDPKVVFQESSTKLNVNIRYWNNQDKEEYYRDFDYTDSVIERLYIDNFFDLGSIYIDLLEGDVYDKNNNSISDVSTSLRKGGNQLRVDYESKELVIDLSNNKTFYQRIGYIDNPKIETATGVDVSDLEVSHKSNHDMGDVFLISGFHQLGDLILRLSDGSIYISQYNSLAEDVYHEIVNDGSEIILHHRGATATITSSPDSHNTPRSNTSGFGSSEFIETGQQTTSNKEQNNQSDTDLSNSMEENILVKLLSFYKTNFGYRDYLKGAIMFTICFPIANFIQHFYMLSSSSVNLFLTASMAIFCSVLLLLSAFVIVYPTLIITAIVSVIVVPINNILLNNVLGLTAGGVYYFVFSVIVLLFYLYYNKFHSNHAH